jgi:hypothetical protein
MKSKRKLLQENQMALGDLPQAVCKPQDSTTNSTAHLRLITKSETLGQIPTDKHCISCGTHLNEKNWWPSFVGKKHYKCISCYDMRRIENKIRKGEKLPSKMLAKLYDKQTKDVYNQVKEGSVYVMENPVWPEWVKVGMAVDAEDRLKNYQTSSPFRDYSLLYVYEVNDRRAGEAAAHARLAKECDNINEWFRLPSAIANELILEVIHEY